MRLMFKVVIFSKNFSITFQKVVMFVVIINQALEVQKIKTAFLLELKENAIFWPQGHSAVHLSVDIVYSQSPFLFCKRYC